MRNHKLEALKYLDAALELEQAGELGAILRTSGAEIRSLLDKIAPEIMFYGIYNAGKSSLINAMLSVDGKEVAPTSDAPCTSVVTPYSLAGYIVWDTPGLDAPQEHERVSKAHLAKCHAVVFVVSDSGNFDEAKIVEELSRVNASAKPLLLVINNKQGGELQSPEFAKIRARLCDKVAMATGRDVTACARMIFGVNALRASEAIIAGSPSRLEQSGVPAVEEEVLKILAEINGPFLLLPAIQLLRSGLEKLRGAVVAKDAAGPAAVAAKMSSALRVAKQGFVEAVGLDVRSYRDSNTKKARVAIASGDASQLDEVLIQYVQIVEKFIDAHVSKAVQDFGREVAASMPPVQVGPKSVGAPDSIDGQGSSSWVDKVDIKRIALAVQSPGGVEAIELGLRGLRSIRFPGIKGRWDRTLGKWAGRIGKGLGVFLTVATTVVELRRIGAEDEKRREAMRERAQEIQTGAETVAHDVEIEVLGQLPKIADEFFAPIQLRVDATVAETSTAAAKLAKVLREIDALDAQVAQLEAEIKAVAQ